MKGFILLKRYYQGCVSQCSLRVVDSGQAEKMIQFQTCRRPVIAATGDASIALVWECISHQGNIGKGLVSTFTLSSLLQETNKESNHSPPHQSTFDCGCIASGATSKNPTTFWGESTLVSSISKTS